MPPFDYARISPGAIHFEGRGGLLYGNEQQFHIKGVNWFGSENRAGPPLGLDKHPISWYMQWLKDNKFNAVRLLFNHQMILSDEPLEPPNEEVYGVGAPWEAPELAHFRYLEMFDKIAEVASDYGILILMAAHRLGPNDWPGNGLWYNGQITEEKVLQSWTKISEKLCGRWNVFAVDLQNEPHSSSWGKKTPATDWGHGAERLGDHVLSHCGRWLIFVEGVGYTPGAPGMDNSGAGIWWGENLYGAGEQPISLMDNTKLVYSPHTYGPSVYEQFYFSTPDFPQNMAAIWTERFEFLRQSTGSPVVIGEMGGHYSGKDKIWQDWAASFMKEKGIGIFYFTLLVGLNAQGDDTGGLLQSDWTTGEAAKLALLATLPSTDVLGLQGNVSPKPPITPPPPAPPSPAPPHGPPDPPPQPSSQSPPPPPLPQPPSPSPMPCPLPPNPPPIPVPSPSPFPPAGHETQAQRGDSPAANTIRGSVPDAAIAAAPPPPLDLAWLPDDKPTQALFVIMFFITALACVGIVVIARKLLNPPGPEGQAKRSSKGGKRTRKPRRSERGQQLPQEDEDDIGLVERI